MLEVRWLSEISKATGELRLFRRPRNPLERDRSGFRTASHSTTYLGLLATHCNHHCSRRQTKDWGGKQLNAFVYLGLQSLLYELHISCVRMMCCVTQLAWLAAQEHELETCELFGLCEHTTTINNIWLFHGRESWLFVTLHCGYGTSEKSNLEVGDSSGNEKSFCGRKNKTKKYCMISYICGCKRLFIYFKNTE